MNVSEISIELNTGGTSQKVVTSTTHAQSAVVALPTNHPKGAPVKFLITPDANTFVRKGTNPTAVSDGTDQILMANNTYRVELMEGERMSFILASGAGNVYITPGA